MITIETSDIKYDPITFYPVLEFSGTIEFNYNEISTIDPNDEETMLMIARELVTQIKMIYTLTKSNEIEFIEN
jgi:hypothetical protein